MVVGPMYAPPYWFTGFRATQDEWRWAIDGFAALGQALASTDLELAIEPINRYETFFLNTAEQGIRLCRAIGDARIGLLLDVAHMAIEEKSLVAAVTAAGDGLKHLHLIENDRGTPGTGSLIDNLAEAEALRTSAEDLLFRTFHRALKSKVHKRRRGAETGPAAEHDRTRRRPKPGDQMTELSDNVAPNPLVSVPYLIKGRVRLLRY